MSGKKQSNKNEEKQQDLKTEDNKPQEKTFEVIKLEEKIINNCVKLALHKTSSAKDILESTREYLSKYNYKL